MDIVMVGMDQEGKTSILKHIKANDNDFPGNMVRTCDGGYLLCANTKSGKGEDKSEDGFGGMDIWIVRMDKDFNILWDKTIGGSLTESNPLIYRINQRDYILTFSSQSPRSGNLTQENPNHYMGLYVIHFTDETIPKNWIARLWKGCHFCGSVKRVSKLDARKFRQDHTINFME
jgi:hypothetical protein